MRNHIQKGIYIDLNKLEFNWVNKIFFALGIYDLKDVLNCPSNDSLIVNASLFISKHGISFPTTSLPISKEGSTSSLLNELLYSLICKVCIYILLCHIVFVVYCIKLILLFIKSVFPNLNASTIWVYFFNSKVFSLGIKMEITGSYSTTNSHIFH